MPLYTVACSRCMARTSVFRKVAERNSNLPTCECGGSMDRVVEAPASHVNEALFESYRSPKTGRVITSRSARISDLRQSGSIPWEPGLRAQIAKKDQALKAEADKKIDDIIDNKVRDLTFSGRLDNA